LVALLDLKTVSTQLGGDLAALAEIKQGVEPTLEERKKCYEDEWKAKGRNPPTEDEWYDIHVVEKEASDNGSE
jgi:hypothetical protein